MGRQKIRSAAGQILSQADHIEDKLDPLLKAPRVNARTGEEEHRLFDASRVRGLSPREEERVRRTARGLLKQLLDRSVDACAFEGCALLKRWRRCSRQARGCFRCAKYFVCEKHCTRGEALASEEEEAVGESVWECSQPLRAIPRQRHTTQHRPRARRRHLIPRLRHTCSRRLNLRLARDGTGWPEVHGARAEQGCAEEEGAADGVGLANAWAGGYGESLPPRGSCPVGGPPPSRPSQIHIRLEIRGLETSKNASRGVFGWSRPSKRHFQVTKRRSRP